MTTDELQTPVPVIDLVRMGENIVRTASYARRHGFDFRPHVKTHKSAYVGGLQLDAGACGLTCATPLELETMQAGCKDLMLAYPTVGLQRAERVATVAERAGVLVMLDSAAAIVSLARAAASRSVTIGVLVEVDVGLRRTGVASADEAIRLARRVQDSPSLEYRGIGFYPGHIREPLADQDAAIAALNHQLSLLLDRLSAADLAPAVVSGGSTPTLWRSHEILGVTEIRPGTSVYNDRTTTATGVSDAEHCALTVLATVVSTAVEGRAVIDAGIKALGREPVRGAAGEGYGALADHPDAVVVSLSEEHGMIDLGATGWRPKVGDQVRVVPNHACIVTHLFDSAVGVRGDVVERHWSIARNRI